MLDFISNHPEIKLLLCCARTHLDAGSSEQIRTMLQTDINWTYLLRMARQHKVTSLLYTNLYTACPETIPPNNLNQLRLAFHTNALNSRFLAKELLKLLHLFETHSLPAIPYKGPTLAESIYGDLAWRESLDLDILIRPPDAPKIIELLIAAGYQPQSKSPTSPETIDLQTYHAWSFGRNDSQVLVDLHWSLTPRAFAFRFDFEQWWKRLQPISVMETTVRSLAPEDLLLLLCVHGAKHFNPWYRLAWVCDVAELIRVHQELDWAGVMVQARRLGSERILLLGLFLAHNLLAAPLPEEIWVEVRATPVIERLAGQVYKQLFTEAAGSLKAIDRHLFPLRVRERWQDRIRYLRYRYSFTRIFSIVKS